MKKYNIPSFSNTWVGLEDTGIILLKFSFDNFLGAPVPVRVPNPKLRLPHSFFKIQ